MKSKAMAAKDLLNSVIGNQLAQSALGAGAAYLGARAVNHISPVDIDPEAALVAGAFGAPMLMKRRALAAQSTPDPWAGSYRDRPVQPPRNQQPDNQAMNYSATRLPPMEWM